ncbi:uncharacterized protein V6R79_010630 [Siganus canaliculatus]
MDGMELRAYFAIMSLKRFISLSRTIRFDDWRTRPARTREEPDKLAPLREIWELWAARLPLGFNPGENVCVDEQLVGFWGCCNFRQYGLKLWVQRDVGTSYAWGMLPYLGKPSLEALPERHQGKSLVVELTAGMRGHTVTTDSFFTPYGLGGRQLLSSVFAFTVTTIAVSYIPKRSRNVLLMSTKHHQADVSQESHQKAAIIMAYNSCKGAVDQLDKFVATYSCRRMTQHWPMSLFSNILDVSTNNALVLWLETSPQWNRDKNFRQRLFLQELGDALVSRVPRPLLR